jgi:hypothetical protein
MKVRVKGEIAPPRVYYAGHADQSTDPFWIAETISAKRGGAI